MNHLRDTDRSFENLDTLSPEEIKRRFEELRVYQIDLETQIEELRKSEEKHRLIPTGRRSEKTAANCPVTNIPPWWPCEQASLWNESFLA